MDVGPETAEADAVEQVAGAEDASHRGQMLAVADQPELGVQPARHLGEHTRGRRRVLHRSEVRDVRNS